MSLISGITNKQLAKHLVPRGKKGILWLVIQVDKVKIRKSTKTSDRTIAAGRAFQILKSNNSGKSAGSVTLSRLSAAYAKAKTNRLSQTYIEDTRASFDRLIETIGDMKISQLTPKHVEIFKDKVAQRVKKRAKDELVYISGYSINAYCRMLRSAFNYAVRMELITDNPFSRFGKVREHHKIPHSYTPKEMASLISKARQLKGEDFAMMLELYLLLGIRREEGCKLQFTYFDFARMILDLPAECTKTKTERIVPLIDRTVEIIKHLQTKYTRPIPFGPDTITEYFNDVKAETTFKGKFHDVRKTFSTWISMTGLSPFFVALVLGHKMPGVTFSNYIDYPVDLVATAIESIPKRLEEAMGTTKKETEARGMNQ